MDKTRVQSNTMHFSAGASPTQRRPRGPAQREDKANQRVADAFGSTYEDYNQPLGDYLMGLEKKAGQAINQFGQTPLTGSDFVDAARSLPSAGTRMATNALGAPQDMSDMIWMLAHAMNRGQQKLTGQDYTRGLLRLQKKDRDWAPGPLENSEQLQAGAKQVLPGALTYEPQGPLGSAIHTAADFVNPEDVGGVLGVGKLMRRFR